MLRGDDDDDDAADDDDVDEEAAAVADVAILELDVVDGVVVALGTELFVVL